MHRLTTDEIRRLAEQTLDSMDVVGLLQRLFPYASLTDGSVQAVPESYVDALTVHVYFCPFDTNFIVELKGGNGFGIITCERPNAPEVTC